MLMITKAYIHEYGNGRLEPEHEEVKQVLVSRGIECHLFTSKRLHRNQLKLDAQTLVVGDNPTIQTVLKRLGVNYSLNSYPDSLRTYLKRSVWETSVRRLMMESHGGEFSPVFVKPSQKDKLFTGFVIESQYDLYKLSTLSKNTELYCSSVVEWLSEFRVFVNKGQIVGMKHYDGNPTHLPDKNEIEKAVADFENSSEKTNGYSLDFGVLGNGETALIEWNDGFSLGSYRLDKELYTELILARWEEILEEAFPES